MLMREFEKYVFTSALQCFLNSLPRSDYIWIEPVTGNEFDVAIGARVTSAEGRRIQVKDDDGVEQWLLPERRIKTMHTSSVQGVEDMISLGDLHEAGILRNLLIRYNDNLIYVSLWFYDVSLLNIQRTLATTR